jgi:cell division control protein 45
VLLFLQIKYVVLVNCGGTIDIVDVLQPEEDVVFFVVDSHKPTDVCNIYNNGQVSQILWYFSFTFCMHSLHKVN